jgi:hypothetical protein
VYYTLPGFVTSILEFKENEEGGAV